MSIVMSEDELSAALGWPAGISSGGTQSGDDLLRQVAMLRVRCSLLTSAALAARAALSDLIDRRDPLVYSDALRQLDIALGDGK